MRQRRFTSNRVLPIRSSIAVFFFLFSPQLFANQPGSSPEANLTRGLCLTCHSINGERESDAPAFSTILNAYRRQKKATETNVAEAITTYASNPQKTKPLLPADVQKNAAMSPIQLPQDQLIAIARYLQTLIPPEIGKK